jgi:Ca2+-binding EF-hand superfamily protein
MLLAAASSALGILQSLTTSKSSPGAATTGLTQNPFDLTSTTQTSNPTSSAPSSGSWSSSGCLSPSTMSALLNAQGQSSTTTTAASTSTSRSNALNDLFSLLDGNGDGSISKTEFENALGAGGTNVAQADDVFGKLDKNGDGSVSLDELSSALKGGHHHHHHAASSDASSGSGTSADGTTDPLMQALSGASSTSTTNSDGTTTTTMTYADGSKVTMTSAPTTGTSTSGATSSYNLIERTIQRQAQAISTSAAASLSFNA